MLPFFFAVCLSPLLFYSFTLFPALSHVDVCDELVKFTDPHPWQSRGENRIHRPEGPVEGKPLRQFPLPSPDCSENYKCERNITQSDQSESFILLHFSLSYFASFSSFTFCFFVFLPVHSTPLTQAYNNNA